VRNITLVVVATNHPVVAVAPQGEAATAHPAAEGGLQAVVVVDIPQEAVDFPREDILGPTANIGTKVQPVVVEEAHQVVVEEAHPEVAVVVYLVEAEMAQEVLTLLPKNEPASISEELLRLPLAYRAPS
jgi:hypothetical protein